MRPQTDGLRSSRGSGPPARRSPPIHYLSKHFNGNIIHWFFWIMNNSELIMTSNMGKFDVSILMLLIWESVSWRWTPRELPFALQFGWSQVWILSLFAFQPYWLSNTFFWDFWTMCRMMRLLLKKFHLLSYFLSRSHQLLLRAERAAHFLVLPENTEGAQQIPPPKFQVCINLCEGNVIWAQ